MDPEYVDIRILVVDIIGEVDGKLRFAAFCQFIASLEGRRYIPKPSHAHKSYAASRAAVLVSEPRRHIGTCDEVLISIEGNIKTWRASYRRRALSL